MKFLHTMVRVSDIDQSIDFYCNKLGLIEKRRSDNPQGKYTLIFLAAPEDALHEYGLRLADWDDLPAADALILAVAHERLVQLPAATLLQKIVKNGCLVDIKGALDPAPLRREGISVWRL